jgi:hypothetical protein
VGHGPHAQIKAKQACLYSKSSTVPNECEHVFKAPDIRAIMVLQDVRAGKRI